MTDHDQPADTLVTALSTNKQAAVLLTLPELTQLLVAEILPRLGWQDLLAFQGTCRAMRSLVADSRLWEHIANRLYPAGRAVFKARPDECRAAVCRYPVARCNVAQGKPVHLFSRPKPPDPGCARMLSADTAFAAVVTTERVFIAQRHKDSYVEPCYTYSNGKSTGSLCVTTDNCKTLQKTHAWGRGSSIY